MFNDSTQPACEQHGEATLLTSPLDRIVGRTSQEEHEEHAKLRRPIIRIIAADQRTPPTRLSMALETMNNPIMALYHS